MKKNHLVIENKFLDIDVPEFNLLQVKLRQDTYQTLNINEIESERHDFTLLINAEKISSKKDLEFSEKFMEITKMNFIAYDYKGNTYRYFTTVNTGDTEYKKNLLKNILTYLKEYENEKKLLLENSKKEFSSHKQEFDRIENDTLLVRYMPEEHLIAVVLKGYAGKDMFSKLASSSERSLFDGKNIKSLKDYELFKKYESIDESNKEDKKINKQVEKFDEILKEEPNYKKLKGKSFFLFKPENYLVIKQAIGLAENNKKEIVERLGESAKQLEQSGINFKDIEITEENDFNFYIKYNEEYRAFEFSCSGYASMYSNEYYSSNLKRGISNNPTSILGVYAKNFIYGKYADDIKLENVEPCCFIKSTSLIETKEPILLEKLDQKINERFLIPVTEFKKLKEIKENYESVKYLFCRENKKISIKGKGLPSMSGGQTPFVYTNGKECILVFKTIERVKKVEVEDSKDDYIDISDFYKAPKQNSNRSVSLIGKRISLEEVDYFFEKHDMAPMIKKNSYIAIGSLNLDSEALLTDENIEKSYMAAMLSVKLHEKSKNEKKEKKLKI